MRDCPEPIAVNARYQTLTDIQQQIIECRQCPRLVAWRQCVAEEKTARYRQWTYWGRPVPGWGDPQARLLVVGLAPAAHGGNRTGRIFTGDRSGDWLYRALHKFGFASQPTSVHRDDGLQLSDCYITAAVHCAPPGNKPSTDELNRCRPYLTREIELLKNMRVVLALGRIAFDAVVSALRQLNRMSVSQRPAFRHGAEYAVNEQIMLLASFHPSQQNTFTGRLTDAMFDAVFAQVCKRLETTRRGAS